jgi:hypothetical protein
VVLAVLALCREYGGDMDRVQAGPDAEARIFSA